jgi:serine/threonine-protein kinase
VLAGVAAFGAGGYLVAALVLFPAPLLPSERHVPRLLGLSETEARGELARQHLQVEVTGNEPHPTADRGEVVWQDPPPGLVAPRGARVSLTLSAGPVRVAVPDVQGFDEMFARRLVRAAGLSVETVDSVLVKDLAAGVVVGSSPPAGDSLLVGRSITLHLAR